MIVTEFYRVREDGATQNKTYSNMGMMIRQDGTGVLYDEAIDPESMGRTYTETDIPIDTEPLDPQEALDMIFGGEDIGTV